MTATDIKGKPSAALTPRTPSFWGKNSFW